MRGAIDVATPRQRVVAILLTEHLMIPVTVAFAKAIGHACVDCIHAQLQSLHDAATKSDFCAPESTVSCRSKLLELRRDCRLISEDKLDFLGAYALGSEAAVHVLAESSNPEVYHDPVVVADFCFEAIKGIRYVVYPVWERVEPKVLNEAYFRQYENHSIEVLMRDVLFQCLTLLLNSSDVSVSELVAACEVCAATVGGKIPSCPT